jgi:hypothetical protein
MPVSYQLGVTDRRGSPLDVRRERVEAEAERLVALGATRVRTNAEEGLDHHAVSMPDPEGNEFDVNQPQLDDSA